MSEKMRPLDIMVEYKPGCGWVERPDDTLPNGWGAEERILWGIHRRKMRRLVWSIRFFGVRKPVVLGTDGRVWDGHHRLLAAHVAKRRVPFEEAGSWLLTTPF
jgi:hypothetical protein